MAANADLAELLDQRASFFARSPTVKGGITELTLQSPSTGVKVHIQRKEFGRPLAQMPYGQEETGDFWCFAQSTGPVADGGILQATSGPWSGTNFWVKGEATDTNIDGISHVMWDLKMTPESTSEIA